MKLEVGKKYSQAGWEKGEFIEVLFLGKSRIFVRDNNGLESTHSLNNEWIPYEKPEKPSTRIMKIFKQASSEEGGAIISFLDEQYEKGVFK